MATPPEIPLNKPAEPAYAADLMQTEATRLMILVKNGDRDAFDQLVVGLRSRAFHVAHGLVGSRDDAMELSQEAFLKTYRARATFREGEPFLPWFHRILRNTCFSFLREDKRGRTRSISAGRKGDDDETPDMELTSLAPGPLREVVFGVGIGMTLFGVAYVVVHDGFVHGRLPLRWLGKVPLLARIRDAHRVHHGRGAAPYGFFLGPQELTAARARDRDDGVIAPARARGRSPRPSDRPRPG